MSRVRVLVVDDSAIVLQAVELGLAHSGMEVGTVENVADLPRMLTERRPDLVLLDVSMPGVETRQVVGLIRDATGTPAVPILLHSDREDAELFDLVAELGADGYLRKTGRREALIRGIEAHLPARSASGSDDRV